MFSATPDQPRPYYLYLTLLLIYYDPRVLLTPGSLRLEVKWEVGRGTGDRGRRPNRHPPSMFEFLDSVTFTFEILKMYRISPRCTPPY